MGSRERYVMKTSNILAAVFIFFAISLVIFARPLLVGIFSPSEDEKAIASVKSEFLEAESALDTAQKAVEAAEIDLESKQNALQEAKEELDTLAKKVAEVEDDPSVIQKWEEEAASEARFLVEVARLQELDLQSGVSISGKAEAGTKINVVSNVSGRIISEPLAAGKFVEADEILCQIEPGTSRAQYQQAKAAYDNANTQLRVAQGLYRQNLSSLAALQNAQAAFEQTSAALKQVEDSIEDLQIKSPIAGVLEADTADFGTELAPGALCTTVLGLDEIKLVGYIPESDLNAVKVGAKVYATLKTLESPIIGEVTSVATSADPVTRAYKIEVKVPNSENSISDGMSARINIAREDARGHLIPQNAITLNSEGQIGVMIYQDNKAVFQPVEISRDTPQGTWIIGLSGEVDVIVQGQEYAKDGREVAAQYQENSASSALDDNAADISLHSQSESQEETFQ